jgi:hypothetical protein
MAPKLATVRGIELAHAGTWALSTGQATFTADDLASAIAALDCPAIHDPVIKLGHVDPRFDGEPACGWISNMSLTRGGWCLAGDMTGMPAWLAEVDEDTGVTPLAAAYPSRSIEGYHDFVCQLGHTHPLVITAVALLGIERPGVGTLTSLHDVGALYSGVAAASPNSGVPFAARPAAEEAPVPNPTPRMVAAGVSTDDVRSAWNKVASWSQWITRMELDPLQLIIIDEDDDTYYRVGITVAEGSVTFAAPVAVAVTFVDKPAAAETVTVASAASPIVYASRAESRPGAKPGEPTTVPLPVAPPAVPPVPAQPAPVAAATEPPAIVPAAEPEPTTQEEDPVSDLSAIRSRLGLADDADEAAILAALDAQTAKPTDPPSPAADPVVPATPAATDTPPAVPAVPEPVPAAEPLVPVAAATPDPRIDLMATSLASATQQLAEIRAERAAAEKKTLIDGAIRAGKITPADRATWESHYDKSAEVTASVLASIAAGSAVPTGQAAGYAGGDDVDVDAEWAQFVGLFPPEPATTTNPKGA